MLVLELGANIWILEENHFFNKEYEASVFFFPLEFPFLLVLIYRFFFLFLLLSLEQIGSIRVRFNGSLNLLSPVPSGVHYF